MSQTPYRPAFQPEGPTSACILHGRELGWSICTSLSFAVGIDRATLGRIRISGCQVRDETGDYIGGTTIEQNAAVALSHGVKVDIHTGPGVASPYQVALALQAGRGVAAAGNLSAVIGTAHQSNGVRVNHNVWLNEVRGGTIGKPDAVFVYDHAANGRHAPWGTSAQGPEWWPWSLALAFFAALRPASTDGGTTGSLLGAGKVYAGIFPDTEPHFWSKFGGVATSPYPDVTTGKAGSTDAQRRLRGGPGFEYKPAGPKLLPVGGQFTAYQTVANAQGHWYGNVDGSLWINGSGLSGLGVRP